jgi:heptosyltransferase-3
LAEDDVREILVINVSRIGDTLLVTPAIRAIAAAYPRARLTFLGHPKRIEIMENLPFIARVGPITKQRALWRGRLACKKRYDLAFVYGHDLPLIEYALRVAKKVVALRQGIAAIDSRLYKAVEPPGFQSAHSVLLQMALPAALGIPAAGHRLAYRVTDQETAWAKATLTRDLPDGAGPLVGLQVASFPTKGYRDWPIGHFIALCRRVLGERGRSHFLIFGGQLERERTQELHRQFPGSSTVYAGKLSLRQTAALMSRLDLYIGVDTGPTHIMGTFDIPMVALYHCYSPSHLIAPLEHPCLYVVDHPDLGKGECGPETPMGKIPVDTVWERVQAALAPTQRQAATVQ